MRRLVAAALMAVSVAAASASTNPAPAEATTVYLLTEQQMIEIADVVARM